MAVSCRVTNTHTLRPPPFLTQIRCVAPFFFDAHVALGGASGGLRFASLVDRSGAPLLGGARQAHGLRLALHAGE